MADQKRWFKVWTSVLADDDFDPQKNGGLTTVGRFCLLGAYTALQGNNGTVKIRPDMLLRMMQLSNLDEIRRESVFHHVVFRETENGDGKITVTWEKWHKYQVDSTTAERMKSLRSKKRREEKREEENKKRINPPIVPPLDFLESLKSNPAYEGMDLNLEFHKMKAWCDINKKHPTERRFLNWLNKADRLVSGEPSGMAALNALRKEEGR